MIQDYENELKEIQAQLDALDKRKKEIVSAIKKEFDAKATTNYGSIQVQITAPYYTLEFDLVAFKQDNEETYNKYLKQVYKPSIVKVVVQKERGNK